MEIDPLIPLILGSSLAILLAGLVMKSLRLPQIVAYLLAGVLLGPFGIGVISDFTTMSHLGEIGVILLLFFLGMEISLPYFVQHWRFAVIGGLLQMIICVFLVWLIGAFVDWPPEIRLLLGFVVSLSSTAVVIRLLQDWKQTKTEVGQNVIGILLLQDLMIIPMWIVIETAKGSPSLVKDLPLQLIGGAAFVGLIIILYRKKEIRLPFGAHLRRDREIQVFSALVICLGFAYLTGLMRLPAALGAFIAGIFISMARETKWVRDSLHSFQVVGVGLFFVSVGMLVDLKLFVEYWHIILILVFIAFAIKTLIISLSLHLLGVGWRRSLYAGALLAQIGEFSFLLAGVGWKAGFITLFGFRLTIAVISLSMLLSPLWIWFLKRLSPEMEKAGSSGNQNLLPFK